jgi:hypothetical protein
VRAASGSNCGCTTLGAGATAPAAYAASFRSVGMHSMIAARQLVRYRAPVAATSVAISDQHSGLVAALRRALQGTGHQRCWVHYSETTIMPTSPRPPVVTLGDRLALSA